MNNKIHLQTLSNRPARAHLSACGRRAVETLRNPDMVDCAQCRKTLAWQTEHAKIHSQPDKPPGELRQLSEELGIKQAVTERLKKLRF